MKSLIIKLSLILFSGILFVFMWHVQSWLFQQLITPIREDFSDVIGLMLTLVEFFFSGAIVFTYFQDNK